MSEPVHPNDVRISDADRQAVADRLRAAHGAGYLDLTEFDERVRAVWQTRTRGDLDGAVRDLPAVPPARRRDGAVFASTPGGVAMRVLVVIWLCVSAAAAASTTMLALFTELSPMSFLVVAAPPGAVLLTLWLTGVGRPQRGRR